MMMMMKVRVVTAAVAVVFLAGSSTPATSALMIPTTLSSLATTGSGSGSSSSSSSNLVSTTTTKTTQTPRGGGFNLKKAKNPLTSRRQTASATAELSDSNADGGGGTATIPDQVFNLVKSIVGAGVLSLPYSIAVYGNAPSAIVPACFLITVMGAISAYTFSLIGRICQKTNTSSYSDAWDVTVGKSTSALIAFSCFFDCFMGNLSYSMILADTVANLAASAGVAVTRTQALLGVTGTILLPLCWMKNLASLAPFSLVGIIGMLYTTFAMGLRWWGKTYQQGGAFFESQLATPIFGSAGASSALSPKILILACMLSNAYIAHFNAPKFLKELKNNTLPRFHQVIGWSFGASIALYCLVTSFGFLTFGAASNGLILNNYSTKDAIMSLSRMAVAVSVTCSYPLIFVGCRDGILDLFQVKKRSNGLLNQVTVATLALVTLLASQLRDLGLVAAVGGATFGTALVFLYPTIMFLKSQTKKTRETIPAAAIGALGLVMGAVGTVLSLKGAV